MRRLLSLILLLTGFQVCLAEGIDLSAYRGKVVYLDFWASWCVPCRESFPWMNKMQQQYGDRLAIVAINLDKDRKLAEDFLKQYPANFEIRFDPDGKLASHYGIDAMPSSIVFNQSGKAVYAHKGFWIKKLAEYESEISSLIMQSNKD